MKHGEMDTDVGQLFNDTGRFLLPLTNGLTSLLVHSTAVATVFVLKTERIISMPECVFIQVKRICLSPSRFTFSQSFNGPRSNEIKQRKLYERTQKGGIGEQLVPDNLIRIVQWHKKQLLKCDWLL